jgi:S-adenosylmethionine:tRNA ribosyltransferase-isomerase
MRLAELEFDLPAELIAQEPLIPRDASRLLVVDRASGALDHRTFRDLPELLTRGDLLVVNDSRVIPARLLGRKAGSGGQVEILLLRPREPDCWEALVRPGRRLAHGSRVELAEVGATIGERLGEGLRLVTFDPPGRLDEVLGRIGQMPLPRYLHTRLSDPERYQTIYARATGSAAAPTAGLHFTPALLAALSERGIGLASVTLHVGLDTFRPVQTPVVEHHPMHREAWQVPLATAQAVAAARQAGRRVVAVGTTSVRALETAARGGELAAGAGWTDLFITPGYRFRCVDAMITNFHLPRTTLFAMVCAFAGAEHMRAAYREAIARRYRLLSFGDAMVIWSSLEGERRCR